MTKLDFHRFQVRHFSNNFEQSPCYCKMGQRQIADRSVFGRIQFITRRKYQRLNANTLYVAAILFFRSTLHREALPCLPNTKFNVRNCMTYYCMRCVRVMIQQVCISLLNPTCLSRTSVAYRSGRSFTTFWLLSLASRFLAVAKILLVSLTIVFLSSSNSQISVKIDVVAAARVVLVARVVAIETFQLCIYNFLLVHVILRHVSATRICTSGF